MGGRFSTPVKVIAPGEDHAEEVFSSPPKISGNDLGRASVNLGSSPSSSGEPQTPFGPLTPPRAVSISRSGSHSKTSAWGDTKPQLRVIQGVYELQDVKGERKKLSDDVVGWFKKRNTDTLQGSLAFVPWILQQAYFEGALEQGKIVAHRGGGAVVFSDASGFTALTERLATRSNGAELLSQCLTTFFTPLINLIHAYRGDVIKFSGDALTIFFQAVDDTKSKRARFKLPAHGSFGLPDLGPMATAVLRASACCIEIHKRLNNFDTGVDGVRLSLHIGVGCGQVTILQVGGVVPPETHVPRMEYIIAGPPLEQISVAEPLAKNGETCLSPQAWEHVQNCVVEDSTRALDAPGFHLLLKMDETKYTFPTIKYSAMERDTRHEQQFQLKELDVIRSYIPSAVFKQIEGGTLTYVNEMRTVSTIFILAAGVDASTDSGAAVAQNLMATVQQICYAQEGTLNKFLIDDKGMLFLLVFGLPPLVHTDDSARAVLACFHMVPAFKRLGITAKFGVTTGRAYCGTCGSAKRMEYTVLGDTVNLSARLMASAPSNGILVDETTQEKCTREVEFTALPSIKVKGKANAIPIFQPRPAEPPAHIGLGPGGRIFFPWYDRRWQDTGGGEAPPAASSQSQQPDQAPPAAAAAAAAAPEERCRANVLQLCGLPDWPGITKVQSLLGGKFSKEMHKQGSSVKPSPAARPLVPVPPGSPFSDGGIICLEGNTGMGKIELAEHMVMHAALNLNILPIFGSIGPRLNDLERIGVELIRSAVGAFRHLDSSLPSSDLEALGRLLPASQRSGLMQVREAFQGEVPEERRLVLLSGLTEVVVLLLGILRKRTPLIVTLQLEYGTNLFPKTIRALSCFWSVVMAVGRLAMPDLPQEQAHRRLSQNHLDVGGSQPVTPASSPVQGHPIVLVVLAKEQDRSNAAVKAAIGKGWFVELQTLSEENCIEYIATYLNVPRSIVPFALRQFIIKISLGNPLYIRETIDELLLHEHIKVQQTSDDQAESLHCYQDLDSINIAAWNSTNMVGETICLLESLDPLQAAVLKMATVFTGPFTLPDLAASICSRWAGACFFDYLRLHRATQDLVKRGIVEIHAFAGGDPTASAVTEVTSVTDASCASSAEPHQTFRMRNLLIRKVGGSMVLEAQKKVVKRQALIDRTLSRDLPARMEQVYNKRNEAHIPWYYESVLGKAV